MGASRGWEEAMVDLVKLRTAIARNRRKLEPFRQNRLMAVKEYVGRYYSDNGSRYRVPVNMINLALNIIARQLAASSPQVLVHTPVQNLKSTAMAFELAINHLLREIHFDKTLRSAVLNALFGMGIVKVGLTGGKRVKLGGEWHEIGQPFAENVSLDDWVMDMSASRWEQVQFMGNRYRVALVDLQESGLFNKDMINKLEANYRSVYNEGTGDERTQSLQDDEYNYDEIEPQVDLWDIWIPRERRMITIPVDLELERPLREVEWEGPEIGPYHILSMGEVPDNVMPLAPVAQMMDLHLLINALYEKLGRQAERQKTILGITAGGDGDAVRIRDAKDGDIIRMDSPDRAKEYSFGGVDNVTLAFAIQCKDLFSYLAGNLDALGGLSPMAETLGQDQLIAANASKQIMYMQDVTVHFSKQVIRSLAWYLFTDPLIDLPLIKRVPDTDIEIPVRFSAEEIEGDFLDYNFEIEAYSLQDRTPQQRLQTIYQLFTQFIIPIYPYLSEQGIGINFEALLKKIGQYSIMPELNEFLVYQQPMMPEREAVGSPPRKSPITSRTYTRVNRSAGTVMGNDYALSQLLMGGGVNEDQMKAILGGVS